MIIIHNINNAQDFSVKILVLASKKISAAEGLFWKSIEMCCRITIMLTSSRSLCKFSKSSFYKHKLSLSLNKNWGGGEIIIWWMIFMHDKTAVKQPLDHISFPLPPYYIILVICLPQWDRLNIILRVFKLFFLRFLNIFLNGNHYRE